MTVNEILLRTAAEPLIAKVVRDMKSGTKRSVRNSVELGMHFSKDASQKEFFKMAKKTFDKPGNIFYELIARICFQVDPKTLKTVGLNVGISTFIAGAKQIRKANEDSGIEHMWLEIIDASELDDVKKVEQKIQNYKINGVSSFVICNIKNKDSIEKVKTLSNKIPEAEFALSINIANISCDDIECLIGCPNLLFCIQDNGEENRDELFSFLKSNSVFFGFTKDFSLFQDLQEELKYAEDMIYKGCLFGIYIDCKGNATDYDDPMYKSLCENRMTSGLPIFLGEFFRDRNFLMEIMLRKTFFKRG